MLLVFYCLIKGIDLHIQPSNVLRNPLLNSGATFFLKPGYLHGTVLRQLPSPRQVQFHIQKFFIPDISDLRFHTTTIFADYTGINWIAFCYLTHCPCKILYLSWIDDGDRQTR